MQAACGLTTCVPSGGVYGSTTSSPAAVLDREDRRRRDALAAVGQRPVGGHEVDRAGLGHAQRERQAGVGRLALEGHPEVLGPGEHVVRRVEGHRLDRRDVQRELEGVADADGTALEVVGVGRRVAAAEVGADVHEHVAGGERPVVDADGVVERLERRARLAVALADDVVLGLELRAALARVVVGGPDVGDDLAGLVVDARRARRCGRSCPRGCASTARTRRSRAPSAAASRVPAVRDDRRDLDPLLGDLLEVEVEGRGHAQAARRRAGRRSACPRRTA